MRVFQATYKDRQGNCRKTQKWYIELRDHLKTIRRISGFKDKKATAELGRKRERLVARVYGGKSIDSPNRYGMTNIGRVPPPHHLHPNGPTEASSTPLPPLHPRNAREATDSR